MVTMNSKKILLANNEELLVRTLDTNDSELHVDFSNKIYDESAYLFQVDTSKNTIEKSSAIINRFKDAPRNFAIGAFIEQELAGLIYIWEVSTIKLYNKNCDLGISVRKSHRGKGIAKALMLEAEDQAKASDYKRLQFSVVSTNEPAIQLYKKLGYSEEGLRKSSIFFNDEYLDELFMGKIIS